MKNINKKLIVIILMAVLSFAGMQNVFAVKLTKENITATGMKYESGVSSTMPKSSAHFDTDDIGAWYVDKTSGTKTSYNGYYVHYSGNLLIYCLDATLVSTSKLYAGRFLFTGQEDLKPVAPKSGYFVADYMLMSALTKGADANIDAIKSGNSEAYKTYFYKSTAIRVINAAFRWLNVGFDNSNLSVKQKNALQHSYDGLLYKWLVDTKGSDYDAQMAENYKFIRGETGNSTESLTEIETKGKNYGWECSDGTASCLAPAKNIVKTALEDAAQYLKGLENAPELEQSKAVADLNATETVVGGQTVLSKNSTHTLIFKNVDTISEPSFVIKNITYADTLDKYGVNAQPTITKITIDGSVICDGNCSSSIGKNLFAGRSFTSQTTVEIVANFTGIDGKIKCGNQPMKYNINYSTNVLTTTNEFSNDLAVVWRNQNNPSSKQRFMAYKGKTTSQPTEQDYSVSGEIALISVCTCEDLERACEEEIKDTNSVTGPACQDLKESNCGCSYLDVVCENFPNNPDCDKRAELCEVTCNTHLDVFECCDEIGETLLVSDKDDHQVNINGIENSNDIKTCFVDKIDIQAAENGTPEVKDDSNVEGVKDQNGNSFTLNSMKENSYCTVSCKEDYTMTMPTAKLVNAGRYFTFRASIEGTKTCYTNTINREKFEIDIERAQENMVTAFNTWSRLNAIVNTPFTNAHSVSGSYSTGCTPKTTEKTPCEEEDKEKCKTTTCVASGKTECSAYVAQKKITYTVCSINNGIVKCEAKPETLTFGSVTGNDCNCNGTVGSCSATDYQDDYNNGKYGDALDDAREDLTDAQDAYKRVISEFNKCSTWESDIKYDPEVTYDYQEEYLTKFGLLGRMDEYGGNQTFSSWYCTGDLSNGNYTGCSATPSTLIPTEKRNFVYCDTNGCSDSKTQSSQNIYIARYKKYSTTISRNYRPSTLFYNAYPSGEIENSENEGNVPLENKLPVSLSTPRGIYKYVVKINNLGEFYDTANGALGRYAGSNTALVGANSPLLYNCAYLVNMVITDQDRLVCDFDDTCTDKCISDCIGPGCDAICDGTDCIADCVGIGCIYDADAGTSLFERTITLNNMFPNGTDSYNWVNAKGLITRSEIEDSDKSNGNAIYNTTPVLSVTITPSVSQEIRRYNSLYSNIGGYSNQTLDCYALGGYEEAACYSSFISDLIDGKFGSNVVDSNSLIFDQNYRTRTDVNGNEGEYFVKWDSGIDEKSMVGPSWK